MMKITSRASYGGVAAFLRPRHAARLTASGNTRTDILRGQFVLRGLNCALNLAVLIGNFQNDLTAA